jgi:hypothetical protein
MLRIICFLKGSQTKTFKPVSPVESGFIVCGDVKDISIIVSRKERN